MDSQFLGDLEEAQKVHITFLLDDSSSMQSIANATRSGFNEYLNAQKLDPDAGEATFSLYKFSSPANFQELDARVNLQEAEELSNVSYNPRGGSTALYDGIMAAISQTEKLIENDPPAGILFVIMTDGEENSSIEAKKEDVFKRIHDLEGEGKWTFIYLGANQDVYAEGTKIGIATTSSFTYTADAGGTASMLRGVSSHNKQYRTYASSGNIAAASGLNLTDIINNQEENDDDKEEPAV